MVVAPGHRRHGIGRRLVLEAGRKFSAAGVVRVSLLSRKLTTHLDQAL